MNRGVNFSGGASSRIFRFQTPRSFEALHLPFELRSFEDCHSNMRQHSKPRSCGPSPVSKGFQRCSDSCALTFHKFFSCSGRHATSVGTNEKTVGAGLEIDSVGIASWNRNRLRNPLRLWPESVGIGYEINRHQGQKYLILDLKETSVAYVEQGGIWNKLHPADGPSNSNPDNGLKYLD